VANEDVSALLSKAYDLLKEHALTEAIDVLEKALSVDFDNDEVVTALKYANFWKERRQSADTVSNSFERAEFLLSQWKVFQGFVERVGPASEQCLFAVRQHVFGQALQYYQRLLQESDTREPLLLHRIGRCHKGKGEYDAALSYLESAAAERTDDAEIIADLADCYALVNEVQAAKAFFREAFFIGPDRIELSSLESEMIQRLVTKVKDMGYTSPALKEWIPVYAVLFGVFTVKRELRSIEYGRLKQSIYAIEREMSDTEESRNRLLPRLINRYFWLIDHYINTREDQSKVDEVLLKLRSIHQKIYQQYIS
jgi:tetratricopeptide (TPR) repeat protein